MSTNARRICLAALVAALAGVAGITAGSALAGGDEYIQVAETHKIPDKGHGKLKLTVAADEDRTIDNTFVGFRVEHPQTKDLRMYLKSPAGTKVVLSDRDTKGANYGDPGTGCNGNLMYLSRNAVQPLSSGVAPYASTFQAAEPLATFDDEAMPGDWTLTIKDVRAGNKGWLQCFVLSMYGPLSP